MQKDAQIEREKTKKREGRRGDKKTHRERKITKEEEGESGKRELQREKTTKAREGRMDTK
jgi:hypothetical protein